MNPEEAPAVNKENLNSKLAESLLNFCVAANKKIFSFEKGEKFNNLSLEEKINLYEKLQAVLEADNEGKLNDKNVSFEEVCKLVGQPDENKNKEGLNDDVKRQAMHWLNVLREEGKANVFNLMVGGGEMQEKQKEQDDSLYLETFEEEDSLEDVVKRILEKFAHFKSLDEGQKQFVINLVIDEINKNPEKYGIGSGDIKKGSTLDLTPLFND